jgi:hypothetical protein
MVWGFSGARSLGAGHLAIVQDIARQAASVGSVYTGCAAGADAAAVAGAGGAAHVFAVGTWYGSGFPRRGTPPAIAWQQGLGAVPASRITWLAGGPLTVPLVARLARRSLAMVRAVALAAGALVAFPASPCPPRAFGPGPFPSCGSGTWATVGAAALLGVPVYVVSSAPPSAVLPVAGAWAQSSLFGVAGWAFVPAQTRAF